MYQVQECTKTSAFPQLSLDGIDGLDVAGLAPGEENGNPQIFGPQPRVGGKCCISKRLQQKVFCLDTPVGGSYYDARKF
jgi:hypothetical protein